jgi:hypothetical protein
MLEILVRAKLVKNLMFRPLLYERIDPDVPDPYSFPACGIRI